jgi:hypothetical protein
MNRHLIGTALCLAALGLVGCNDHKGYAANPHICADFKAKTAPANPMLAAAPDAAPVDDCVRRWAYSLAPTRDNADVVAQAVVAACSGPLSRWNQQNLAQTAPATDALSITTGEPTNPLVEHNNFAHSQALLYVVQARAGRCAPPAAANGVPEGVTG